MHGVAWSLLADKEDSKQERMGEAFRNGVLAMANENRGRFASAGDPGTIHARASRRYTRGPLRTESGSIIG